MTAITDVITSLTQAGTSDANALAVAQAYVPPSPYPKWRQGLPIGQWAEIAGTSLSKVTPPVPSGNINAWCGLASIDDPSIGTMFVSAAGGGHSDSNDNGVYAIDFSKDAPAWFVMCPPSALADRVTAAESGTGMPAVPYAHDGKPNSCHLYWAIGWHPLARRVIRPWASSLWYGSQGSPTMDGFDPVAGKWDPAGTWSTGLYDSYQAGFALDPTTGDIFYGATATSAIYRLTWATKTWAQIHPTGSFGWLGFHGSCVDVKRNRIVSSGTIGVGSPTNNMAQIPTLDLATLVGTVHATPWIPNPPLHQLHIVHDTGLDKYVLTDSVTVYQIDPVTWLGQALPPIPVTPVNGLHNRFAYFQSLKGIVCYPAYATNCWFMATE